MQKDGSFTLINLKCIHELCSLLPHIPTYFILYNIISMFYIYFRDFLKKTSLLVLTLSGRKCFLSVFDFLGGMGLKKGQGQRARLGNLVTNKMS
jgi:hypothetical protein